MFVDNIVSVAVVSVVSSIEVVVIDETVLVSKLYVVTITGELSIVVLESVTSAVKSIVGIRFEVTIDGIELVAAVLVVIVVVIVLVVVGIVVVVADVTVVLTVIEIVLRTVVVSVIVDGSVEVELD